MANKIFENVAEMIVIEGKYEKIDYKDVPEPRKHMYRTLAKHVVKESFTELKRNRKTVTKEELKKTIAEKAKEILK